MARLTKLSQSSGHKGRWPLVLRQGSEHNFIYGLLAGHPSQASFSLVNSLRRCPFLKFSLIPWNFVTQTERVCTSLRKLYLFTFLYRNFEYQIIEQRCKKKRGFLKIFRKLKLTMVNNLFRILIFPESLAKNFFWGKSGDIWSTGINVR